MPLALRSPIVLVLALAVQPQLTQSLRMEEMAMETTGSKVKTCPNPATRVGAAPKKSKMVTFHFDETATTLTDIEDEFKCFNLRILAAEAVHSPKNPTGLVLLDHGDKGDSALYAAFMAAVEGLAREGNPNMEHKKAKAKQRNKFWESDLVKKPNGMLDIALKLGGPSMQARTPINLVNTLVTAGVQMYAQDVVSKISNHDSRMVLNRWINLFLLRATFATQIFEGEWTKDVEGVWRTLFVLRSLNKHLGAQISMKSGCWSNEEIRQRILATVKQLFNPSKTWLKETGYSWPKIGTDAAELLFSGLTSFDDHLNPQPKKPPAYLPARAKKWMKASPSHLWPSAAKVGIRGVAVTRQLQWLLSNFECGMFQKVMEKCGLDNSLKDCRTVVEPKFKKTIAYANDEKKMKKVKEFQQNHVWKAQKYRTIGQDDMEKLGKNFDNIVLSPLKF